MDVSLDLIIIGAGPAGLSAAVYASRAGLSFFVIEKNGISGGQIINTASVDNYLGLKGIDGFSMGNTFREHAEAMGAKIVSDDVLAIDIDNQGIKHIRGQKDTYEAKSVIFATGAKHALLNVSGEERFTGRGVSYCATCDGFFFKGLEVAVVGGGDVAVADAIYLSEICSKVTVIHRRDELRATGVLVDSLMKKENVSFAWNSVVTDINGSDTVSSIKIKNTKDGSEESLSVSGIFVAVGMIPNTSEIKGLPKTDTKGYIIANEDGVTDIPGFFVAGDVRTKALRQVVTAVSDGANALNSALEYLHSNY